MAGFTNFRSGDRIICAILSRYNKGWKKPHETMKKCGVIAPQFEGVAISIEA